MSSKILSMSEGLPSNLRNILEQQKDSMISERGWFFLLAIVVVKNTFRFELFVRTWQGGSLFEVRSLNKW